MMLASRVNFQIRYKAQRLIVHALIFRVGQSHKLESVCSEYSEQSHEGSNVGDDERSVCSNVSSLAEEKAIEVEVHASVTDDFHNGLDWTLLPMEIMMIIVEHMSSDDIQNGRLVCKEWKNAVSVGIVHLAPRRINSLCKTIDLFPNIMSLDLRCARMLRDQSLMELLEIQRLSKIDLSGCEDITDVSAKNLGLLPKLNWLSLKNCVKITDETILSLCKCVFVHPLKKYGAEETLRNYSISFVGKQLVQASIPPPLEYLDVSGCVLLTELSTTAVSNHLHSIKELRLGGCSCVTSISDAELQPLSVCSRLSSLDISGCVTVTNSGLSPLLIHLKDLKHLNLWNCLRLDSESLSVLANINRHFTELSLRGCHGITDDIFKYIATLKGLERLDIRSCEQLKGHGLKELAPLENLVQLNMKGCFGLQDSGMDGVGSLKHLKQLCLADCWQITDFGMSNLKNLKCMTSLDLSGCRNIVNSESSGISALDCMINLRHLTLRNCERLHGEKALSSLQNLHHLEFLDISGCYKIPVQALRSISQIDSLQVLKAEHCLEWRGPGALCNVGSIAHLQELYLSGCTNLVGTSLSSLRSLKNLRVCVLDGCTNIPLVDKGLVAVASSLTSLRSLSLQGCLTLTDTGLEALGRIKTLHRVNLTDCYGISGQGFTSWNGMSSLKSVILQGCSSITDQGMFHLTRNLSSLTLLNLKQCRLITDSSVMYICSLLPNLKQLYFQASLGITDLGISEIARTMKFLTHLSIQFCWQFGDESAIELASMASLKYLDLLYSWKITDATVFALANSTSLVECNIFGCHRVTAQARAAIETKLDPICR